VDLRSPGSLLHPEVFFNINTPDDLVKAESLHKKYFRVRS